MNCPSCGQLNQETAKFCSECATPLRPVGVCAACGHENTRSSKFCSECAAPLAPATPHPVSSAPTPTPAPSSAPSPALPSSFADGRYTVKGFLGEGGRKRVYLAHDTKLDRDVAVAVIKTEGLDFISPVSEPQITIDIARRLATEGNRSGPSAFPDHLEKLAVEVEVLNSNSGKLGTAQSGIE